MIPYWKTLTSLKKIEISLSVNDKKPDDYEGGYKNVIAIWGPTFEKKNNNAVIGKWMSNFTLTLP